MRILVVEDEIKIRQGISKLISAHTDHVVAGEAKNGKEGLEMLLRLRPDIVISDIRMPVMDGLEMVETAKAAGAKCHFVILSGYSEFEYARKALRYGVDDYLLKPLGPEDVIGLLDKLQAQISKEEEQAAETAEGLIRDILLGGRTGQDRDYEWLQQAGTFFPDMGYYLAAGYVGDTGTRYTDTVLEQLEKMKAKYPQNRIRDTFLENTQEIFCLIQCGWGQEELEQKLARRVYLSLESRNMPVWALVPMQELPKLKEAAETLREWYLYGLLCGYRTILTREKIAALSLEEYRYPSQLEAKLRTAVCSVSPEMLEKSAEAFKKSMREVSGSPFLIRGGYEKMAAFVENVCHETNEEAYKALQGGKLRQQIAKSITRGELEDNFDRMIHCIAESGGKKEDIRNYTIQRAIAFIREHYRENISLELLAGYLEITPEYLSTLFNREVGINFSTFLKRFRISQAKRLLRGTDKKIYEIALETGYNDPKYFNRVFKEEIGVSPGDYRQLK